MPVAWMVTYCLPRSAWSVSSGPIRTVTAKSAQTAHGVRVGAVQQDTGIAAFAERELEVISGIGAVVEVGAVLAQAD